MEPLIELVTEEMTKCAFCGETKALSEMRQYKNINDLPFFLCSVCLDHINYDEDNGTFNEDNGTFNDHLESLDID